MTHVVDFRKAESAADLAHLIGCRESLVESVLAKNAGLFKHHRLPKRGRSGFRDVWEATNDELRDAFKALQRRLDAFFHDVLPGYPDDAAHGYVGDRSIRTNAEVHTGSKRIVRADIKGFFPSITRPRLDAFLRGMGFEPAGAAILSGFVTHDDHLALGLNTSPTLANAICVDLDRDLRKLASTGLYTRYADDLTFSGDHLPSRIELESVLEKHGFRLAKEKFREQVRGRGIHVTGLNVEEPGKPLAARRFKKRLEQELHYASKHGLYDHLGRRGYPTFQSGINRIHGRIQFLRGIEREKGDRLHEQWMEILEAADERPTFQSRKDRKAIDVLFSVDESLIPAPNGHVLALSVAAIVDVDYARSRIAEHLRRLKLTPFLVGRKAKLEAKGLHWTDLSDDMKAGVVDLMSRIPARVFVAYGHLPAGYSSDDYRRLYHHLLTRLIAPRLGRYDGGRIHIVVEVNDQIREPAIRKSIGDAYNRLAANNGRRPLTEPEVRIAKKTEEPCLSIPDTFLGVFMAYAMNDGPQPAHMDTWRPEAFALRFEQLRDRYRMILEVVTDATFSRRRPFTPWPEGVPPQISVEPDPA